MYHTKDIQSATVKAWSYTTSLTLRHNEHDGISNHLRPDGLLNHLFGRRSKKTSKLRVIGLCEGNSPVTGEFPSQRPVTQKLLPFDDVIMEHFRQYYNGRGRTLPHWDRNKMTTVFPDDIFKCNFWNQNFAQDFIEVCSRVSNYQYYGNGSNDYGNQWWYTLLMKICVTQELSRVCINKNFAFALFL